MAIMKTDSFQDVIKELSIPQGSLIFYFLDNSLVSKELKRHLDYNIFISQFLKDNNVIEKDRDIYLIVKDSDHAIYKLPHNKPIIYVLPVYSKEWLHINFEKHFYDIHSFFFITDERENEEFGKFFKDYIKLRIRYADDSEERKWYEELLTEMDTGERYDLKSNINFFSKFYALYSIFKTYGSISNDFIKDYDSIKDELENIVSDIKRKTKNFLYIDKEETNKAINEIQKSIKELSLYYLGTKDFFDVSVYFENDKAGNSNYFLLRGKDLEESILKGFIYRLLNNNWNFYRLNNKLDYLYLNVDDILKNFVFFKVYIDNFDLKDFNMLQAFVQFMNSGRFIDDIYALYKENLYEKYKLSIDDLFKLNKGDRYDFILDFTKTLNKFIEENITQMKEIIEEFKEKINKGMDVYKYDGDIEKLVSVFYVPYFHFHYLSIYSDLKKKYGELFDNIVDEFVDFINQFPYLSPMDRQSLLDVAITFDGNEEKIILSFMKNALSKKDILNKFYVNIVEYLMFDKAKEFFKELNEKNILLDNYINTNYYNWKDLNNFKKYIDVLNSYEFRERFIKEIRNQFETLGRDKVYNNALTIFSDSMKKILTEMQKEEIEVKRNVLDEIYRSKGFEIGL